MCIRDRLSSDFILSRKYLEHARSLKGKKLFRVMDARYPVSSAAARKGRQLIKRLIKTKECSGAQWFSPPLTELVIYSAEHRWAGENRDQIVRTVIPLAHMSGMTYVVTAVL